MKNIIELGSTVNIKGKAGNLNRLYDKFNISRGFIISDEFFREFLKFNNIEFNLNDKDLSKKIEAGRIPFYDELIDYFQNRRYQNVIVRSSASIEDGDKYSFAGVFSSFLNVTKDTLIDNIKKCWMSSCSQDAISYIFENKISENFKFDVLVQEVINTTVAGIAFSINPSTGENGTLVEATNSICAYLVSGQVIPHTYNNNNSCDEMFLEEQFLKVDKSLKELKSIFKCEVEIEFGFKNDVFYLFQVRPITKEYYSLINHIENVYWCSFKNNNWNLFNRTLWIMGATKYKNTRIKNGVTEDMTLYLPHNEHQIRAFNGGEPPLDEETIRSHKEEDILKYIDEYNVIVDKMYQISKKIQVDISKNDFNIFKRNFKNLICKHAKLEAYEYLIGSLGQALYDKISKNTIKEIEEWRNNETNSYFPIYDKIFLYIVAYFNLNLDYRDFAMYVHVKEVINFLDNKLSRKNLLKRISEREEKGFVLFNFHNSKYQNKIEINEKIIESVKSRFNCLQNNVIKNQELDGIKGQAAFKSDTIIKGECIVIKGDLENVKEDLSGKIVVLEVTTARDINILKSVKALVVESGGILCHSAIFSREFGIPCLFGCVNATNYFKSGNILEVDLNKEFVKGIND